MRLFKLRVSPDVNTPAFPELSDAIAESPRARLPSLFYDDKLSDFHLKVPAKLTDKNVVFLLSHKRVTRQDVRSCCGPDLASHRGCCVTLLGTSTH